MPSRLTSVGSRAGDPLGPFVTEQAAPLEPGTIELSSSERSTLVAVSRLQPLRELPALLRVSVHATGTILMVLILGLMVMIAGLASPGVRAVWTTMFRSYPRRLILIITLLLLVPLTLLNLVLSRSLSEASTVAQRTSGETALRAAQTILVDHLTSLPAGYSIDNALDDALLLWLSEVVQHEVNLYWRGQVYASSRPDLFSTNLLPARIPGAMLARLGSEPTAIANRTRVTAGGLQYLELYGPLALPGDTPGDESLFLSVPLLAQQSEAASAVEELVRRNAVATTALFLILLAVGSRLAESFARPVMAIVEGTKRIAAGEERLGLEPDELELATLTRAIDTMAQKISQGRRALEREKQVLEGVVDNITAGVVSFDDSFRVSMRNRVAHELLGATVGATLEELLSEGSLDFVKARLLPAQRIRPVRETVRLPAVRQDDGSLPEASVDQGPAREQEWNLVWLPVPGTGDPAALLVVEDASEVLRNERLEAWAEMARMIAHEIKNPLTPIRLSTEHLKTVYERSPERLDEVFERCTSTILEQVDELYETAGDFSAYSRILVANPAPFEVTQWLGNLLAPYQLQGEDEPILRFEPSVSSLEVEADARLLARAVRNLLENALRATRAAMRAGNDRPDVGHAAAGEVVVKLLSDPKRWRIEVLDTGRGVPQGDLERIFQPYFSTASGGTGLGLPITRSIAEAHGGTAHAKNRKDGGLRVILDLPRRVVS